MEPKKIAQFNIFAFSDDVKISRLGKTVSVVGRDGTNVSSETVEANLLYELLKVLKKK